MCNKVLQARKRVQGMGGHGGGEELILSVAGKIRKGSLCSAWVLKCQQVRALPRKERHSSGAVALSHETAWITWRNAENSSASLPRPTSAVPGSPHICLPLPGGLSLLQTLSWHSEEHDMCQRGPLPQPGRLGVGWASSTNVQSPARPPGYVRKCSPAQPPLLKPLLDLPVPSRPGNQPTTLEWAPPRPTKEAPSGVQASGVQANPQDCGLKKGLSLKPLNLRVIYYEAEADWCTPPNWTVSALCSVTNSRKMQTSWYLYLMLC